MLHGCLRGIRGKDGHARLFFTLKTVGKIPHSVKKIRISDINIYIHLKSSEKRDYKLSSQFCMPSFRLGLTLCLISSSDALKKNKTESKLLCSLSNIILFLWFHKLQQQAIIAILKKLLPDLFFASIIISLSSRLVSQVSPIFSQNSVLNLHEKKRCGIVSCTESSHRTQDVDSTWKFFLVSRSLVFIQSCIISP